MATFIMLTRLTSDGVKTIKDNPSRVQEVNKEVEQLGVKVLNQWATLGEYDFITVVEAPDEKAMAKLSIEMGSRGTVMNETLTAIDAEEFTVRPYEGPRRRRRRSRARDRRARWRARHAPRSSSARPGNAGIAADARCLTPPGEVAAGGRGGRGGGRDLVVVGPEAPLVAGLVDALEAEGVAGVRADAPRPRGSRARRFTRRR